MQVALGLHNFLSGFLTGAIDLKGWDKIKLDCTFEYLFGISEDKAPCGVEELIHRTKTVNHVPVELGLVQHMLIFKQALIMHTGPGGTQKALDMVKERSPLEHLSKVPEDELYYFCGYDATRAPKSYIDEYVLEKYYNCLRYLASDFVKVYYRLKNRGGRSDTELREKYDGTSFNFIPQLETYLRRGNDVYHAEKWHYPQREELPGPLSHMGPAQRMAARINAESD